MAYNHNNSTMVKNIHGTSDERYKIGNLHKKQEVHDCGRHGQHVVPGQGVLQ